MDFESLKDEWKSKVFDKEGEIDPDGKQDWYSMALGFALANDISPAHAHKFADYLIYNSLA